MAEPINCKDGDKSCGQIDLEKLCEFKVRRGYAYITSALLYKGLRKNL